MLPKLILVALIGSSLAFLETILNREVCYGDLGCFNTQSVRSTSRLIVLLPQTPDQIGTRFFLYTRNTSDMSKEEELNRNQVNTLTGSHFDASKPTKIIIHGFTHSAHEPWVQKMKDELLKNADMNVIAVDWRRGAGLPYTQATANIRVVAAQLAKLIEVILQENRGMSTEQFHMIGHSLGAHCASEVGTRIKRIGRISGLDPAEPYFEGGKELTRLEPRDAEFVDVIHSDGSAFLNSLGMGYRSSIGHVDFYPNGGAEQPGCSKTVLTKLTEAAAGGLSGGIDGLKNSFACSHLRSVTYYTESINGKCPYMAYPCKTYDDFKSAKCLDCSGGTCSKMGYHAIESVARGDFYLMTNQKGDSPQCSYHYVVSVKTGIMTSRGYGKMSITLMAGKNQTFGPISLTDDEGYIESSKEVSRLVIVPSDMGKVTSVKVTYEKASCLTCLFYSDFVRIQHVVLKEGENQKKTSYCGKNVSVAKGQYRKLDADLLQGC